MKERIKRIWRKVKRRLPSVSRRGRVIRNFAFILLTVVLFWWAVGAPAMTPQWRYRRAERQNLLRDTEIIAVLEPQWINWDEGIELVVGENEALYAVCLTKEPFYAMDLQIYRKQGAVTFASAPDQWRSRFFTAAIPFLVLTELPAVRAELELVIPPELSWRFDTFAGATYRGEDNSENGVFSFSFPSGLTEVEAENYNDEDLTDQLIMEWDALHILRETLQGIKQRGDFDCSVTAHIRLWDAEDTLIYDEVLTYPIEVVE